MKNIDYLASRGVASGMMLDEYMPTYYQTNENLVDMYEQIDFNNKKVLSVMGSGDQVLTSYFLGAKKVDAFDKNRLSIYYYYLRLWSIKYMNMLYPEIDNKRWMYSLLKLVNPKNEIEAKVRKFYLNHLNNNTNLNKLFYNVEEQPDGKTLYSSAKDLKDLIEKPINFYVADMFLKNKIDKKYDIIIMSNILEWARGNKKLLDVAKYNINNLLNEDGIVLSSSLIRHDIDYFNDYEYHDYGLGYSYTRKK